MPFAGDSNLTLSNGTEIQLASKFVSNGTLPEVAMETYAGLGDFIRSCYGEGSLASSTALAATTQGCTGCMNVTLKLQALAGVKRLFRFRHAEDQANLVKPTTERVRGAQPRNLLEQRAILCFRTLQCALEREAARFRASKLLQFCHRIVALLQRAIQLLIQRLETRLGITRSFGI